jgi:hypothetical protein
MYFDPIYWLFLIPGFLLGIYAQIKLSATYKKYSRLETRSGITGAQAAREVLDRAGLTSMPIREVPGRLTDHYDPIKKQLCLSTEVYRGSSIASVGVAAHEAGHALQHKAAYAPLKLRMWLVPATQIAGQAYIPIFIIGLIVPALFPKLILAIVAIFAMITLFQLITLPVEFDASRRAKEQLARMGLIDGGEGVGVAKVLNAAALTYVAAMVSSMLQLAYWLMVARNSR